MTTASHSTLSRTLPQRGERFECGKCGMEIAVLSDCHCDQGVPEFICCGQLLTPAGQGVLAETKEAFIHNIQQGLDQARENVAWLKKKANQAKDTTKAEASLDARLLSEQYDKLKRSLAEVKDSSGEAWKDLAKGCSESWQRFKTASRRAMSRYRSQD